MIEALMDPERRKVAQEEQMERRELKGHKLANHPAVANYRYGVAREKLVRPQLGDPQRGKVPSIMDSLAEGYALQGRFGEAAAMAATESFKSQYATNAIAVGQLGVKQCACPDSMTVRQPGNAKGKVVPSFRMTDHVFDGEKLIVFRSCLICQSVSAYTP